MKTNTSSQSSWLIWFITILAFSSAFSSAFMTYIIYMPSTTDTSLTSHKKVKQETINANNIIDSKILKMQQQFITQLVALKKQGQNNMQEIMLIKEAQEEMQQTFTNNEIDQYNKKDITDNNNQTVDEPPLSEAVMQAQQQEYMQSINDKLASQDEDSIWTNQVTDNFKAAFENYSDQLVLHDVTCGSTICKLNASINTDQLATEEPAQLDHLINGEARWPGQSLYEMNTETGEVTVYLAREGEQLPQVN